MAGDLAMQDGMDIDLVLDDEDEELAQMRATANAMKVRAQAVEKENENEMTGIETEEGEVDGETLVPTKVHIRGLDNFTTADIIDWIKQNHTKEHFQRLEWIDDTSANLLFEDEAAATEALAVLSTEEAETAGKLRAAKKSAIRPETNLEIRQAMVADVKLPGAKDRSRFYLMNPEHDPDVRYQNGRKRRYRDDREQGDYSKRRRGDYTNQRRSSLPVEKPFNVDFYDDDAGIEDDVQVKKGDLFSRIDRRGNAMSERPNNGRLQRDRSASPIKDGDGLYGFEDNQPYRKTARRRSITPELHSRQRNDADRQYSTRSTGRDTLKATKELFPDKAAHRRTDAQDLDADEVASIVGDDEHPHKKDLFSRVTGGPPAKFGKGRLSPHRDEFSRGFSILGASERRENPLVKELFPAKAKNSSKELFDGRVKGRATRHRAEDLF